MVYKPVRFEDYDISLRAELKRIKKIKREARRFRSNIPQHQGRMINVYFINGKPVRADLI